MTAHMPNGTHVITDIRSLHLNDENDLSVILIDECERGGATVVDKLIHSFQPQGKTVVVILEESHAIITTYPEHDIAMIDVFTCGDKIQPKRIADAIVNRLSGEIISESEIHRGSNDPIRS